MDVGTVVDSKYQIVRLLGQGGMGAVYEARHLGTSRRVALKVIVPEALELGGSDVVARFQREARASGAIDSQHVVQILDTGVDPTSGSPYIVMEHLTGEDLLGLIQRIGPLAPELALRIIAQACAGLAKAHAEGVVHRDIKAANLFLAQREGGEIVVKLLDFGIAKMRRDPMQTGAADMTQTGTMLGSPLYMSPEQVVGDKAIDARADLYSLGITLYEALSATTPHRRTETMGALVLAICTGRGEPIQTHAPWVSASVAAIVETASAVEASNRFVSADAMRAAILTLLPHGAALHESMLVPSPEALTRPRPSPRVLATTPSEVQAAARRFLPETTSSRSRRAWWIVAPVAVILAGTGLGLGIYALSSSRNVARPDVVPPAISTAVADVEAPDASAAADAGTPTADTAPPAPAKPQPPPAKPVPSMTKKPSCNPNYYFDQQGVKHFKEECF